MLEAVLILLALSGSLMVILAVIAFDRWSQPAALSFGFCAVCAGLWDFGFAAETINPTLSGKILWANIQFLAITFLPFCWLMMTMFVTGQPRSLKRLLPLLAVVPLLTNIVIWTDNLHHVFRIAPYIKTVDMPFPVLANNYGPYFYYVHAPYNYLLFAASITLLIHSWRKTPAFYRKQRISLLISVLLPLMVDTLYVLGITPIPAFNFTSIFFSLSGLLLSVNVLSLRFLDILPLAYETAVHEMNVGVIVLDAFERISYINPAGEQILHGRSDKMIGLKIDHLSSNLGIDMKVSDGDSEIVIAFDGAENTFQIHCTTILHGKKKIVGRIITMSDITERARLYRQVERMSIIDPLTESLNRRALVEYGEKEIEAAARYGRELTFVMLDVDNFKEMNDKYGHLFGDEILVSIVSTIQAGTRANDLVCRYGGDEFVVLLHETGEAEGIQIAERIQNELVRLKVEGSPEGYYPIQVSFGITSFRPGDSLESMLRRVDDALYRAKAGGKGIIVVQETAE